jgi:hypothetical protein
MGWCMLAVHDFALSFCLKKTLLNNLMKEVRHHGLI